MNEEEKNLLNNLNLLQSNVALTAKERDYLLKGLNYLAEKLDELAALKALKNETKSED